MFWAKLIDDHSYRYPPSILAQFPNLPQGIYPPMVNCAVCNQPPDLHIPHPDDERYYRSWPPNSTGFASYPVPAEIPC